MSVERHQRSEQLFYEALQQPRHEREEFLFEACGKDWALYQEVLSLVRRHEETHVATSLTIDG